jgi:DNA excision repair protein ERCC-2
MMPEHDHKQYTVAVRALAEFAAKRGDLDTRFTPSSSAFEGNVGHRIIAARRGPDYRTEITLSAVHGTLRVRGRADGYDPQSRRLEEYKTYRGNLHAMPGNRRALHWAQLKIYGALLCLRDGLTTLDMALVYFDVNSEAETVLGESCSAAHLTGLFELYCERFSAWALAELQHRQRRDRHLAGMAFPLHMHASQRRLAEAVYKSIRAGKHLLAQAPTGIGKTLGTLFPALKAMPRSGLDKLFVLVAKTSGRAPALQAARMLPAGDAGTPLRVLELVAKAHACVLPGNTCRPDGCPLAKGFYDRLPPARTQAAESADWTQTPLRDVASRHGICPYYLSQELVRWADVIVADYNYFFDGSAMLHALAVQNRWRIVTLVDEAHNLLPRARENFSASLSPQTLGAARARAPATLHAALDALASAWPPAMGAAESHRVLPCMPAPLRGALERALQVMRDTMSDVDDVEDAEIAPLFFSLWRFRSLVEDLGSHSLLELGDSGTLSIRNLVPAGFLAPRFASSVATILFSATLFPEAYYRELLGLGAANWIDVASAFAPAQLSVRIARRISTRFRDRAASSSAVVALMARQYQLNPGSYLAFFSSFDYLRSIAGLFRCRHPDVSLWEQSPSMSVPERDAFLARHRPGSAGIGFAVLGGVFAEGIDLPGDSLIGAFILTLGMPQVNPLNAMMETRMRELFGKGYEYVYLYPGLQKVVQAAGRVIRTTTDVGSLHLLDDRFARPEVLALLPAWWRVEHG